MLNKTFGRYCFCKSLKINTFQKPCVKSVTIDYQQFKCSFARTAEKFKGLLTKVRL